MRNRSATTTVACPNTRCGGQVRVKATDYPALDATPPDSDLVVLAACDACGEQCFTRDQEDDMWWVALYSSGILTPPGEESTTDPIDGDGFVPAHDGRYCACGECAMEVAR
jgi:hypothetical protein